LTLAANGIDALHVLEADTPALAAGFPTPSITLRSATGKRLGETSTGGSLPAGTTSQTIKRADLYWALHQEAWNRGVRIEHGKRLVEAHDTGDQTRAVFADGSEAVGDVLIGCDGVHSAVRRIIDPAAPAPTYGGLLTTGGYARGVQVDTEPGGYEMIFGNRAFFGYAVAPDREVWWFANVPRGDEPARGEVEAISGEDWRHQLLELYSKDAGPAVALIQATPQIMPMSPIHAIPRLPAWHNERMIVIGDAPTHPHPPPAKAPRCRSRTPSCSRSACATYPTPRWRSPPSKRHAGPGSNASSNGPPASTTTRPPAPSPERSATRCCRRS
jgi:2-polyprenyl-6-methoxyphenol hydroxylase-like FAD-dependent oxidoreductase